jgi:hypothetical protein
MKGRELTKKIYAKAGKPLTEFHHWIKVAKTTAIAVGVPGH